MDKNWRPRLFSPGRQFRFAIIGTISVVRSRSLWTSAIHEGSGHLLHLDVGPISNAPLQCNGAAIRPGQGACCCCCPRRCEDDSNLRHSLWLDAGVLDKPGPLYELLFHKRIQFLRRTRKCFHSKPRKLRFDLRLLDNLANFAV